MSTTVTELRQQLREHFPEAHAAIRFPEIATTENEAQAQGDDETQSESEGETNHHAPGLPIHPTGIAALDRVGIPPGAITELVSHHASGGVALLTHALLENAAATKTHLALIDSRDHFDPGCADNGKDLCQSLLWLRCDDVESSLKAADLLLRDGNLPLVVADFQLESPRALRAVPTSSWHRLRALAEKTGTTLLSFTPAPLIPTAHLRLNLTARFSLDALNQPRASLLEDLPLTITRRIGHSRSHPLAAAS